MKKTLLLLLTLQMTLLVSSQLFKKDETVEVEPTLSDSLTTRWKQATFLDYDSTTQQYHVKLMDGNKIYIPSKKPEQWIRPVPNRHVVLKYGPGARIPYESRDKLMKPIRCNGSEAAVKRNIKSQMAAVFKDYPSIYVDFTSFKAQNGYDDPKNKGQQIYTYKIEMRIHLRRSLIFAGNEYTEYKTWAIEREYNYATRAGKTCEFYVHSTDENEMIERGWY